MQKNLPIIIGTVVLILAVVGGVGGYAIYKKEADTKSSASSSSSTAASKFNLNNVGKPSELLGGNLSLECTVNDGGKESIAFIKNGALASKSDKTNIILKDSKLLSWEDGEKDGIIIAFDANTLFKDIPDSKNNSSVNSKGMGPSVDQDFNKFKESCKPAVISDDKFNPPKEVKFQDFQAMMKAEMEKSGLTEEQLSSFSALSIEN